MGGETRCAEVMDLNEEWKLRFENMQPEWLNEFLSSLINPGIGSCREEMLLHEMDSNKEINASATIPIEGTIGVRLS